MSIAKRTYTVPLRKGYRNTQRPQRAKKAVSVLRTYLKKHMKSEEVRIAKALNEHLWENGIKNPPGKVTIVAEKNDEGIVHADLEGNKLPSELESSDEKKSDKKEAKQEKTESKKDAEEKPAKQETTEKPQANKSQEKPKTQDKKPSKKESEKKE